MDKSITDFSKHLLITVFAIFAFTSAPLLGASNILVKVFYCASLFIALLGMHFCNRAHLAVINDFTGDKHPTNNKQKNVERLSDVAIVNLKQNTQYQYYCTQISMFCLVISIIIFFCTDNPMFIKVEQILGTIPTQISQPTQYNQATNIYDYIGCEAWFICKA